MKKDIQYIKLDGRGESEEFQKCVLDALEEIKPNEGLHIIKEFEPFPLYSLMEKRGFEKFVEKINDDEFHAWFFPKDDFEEIEMKKHLDLDNDRIRKMLDIKLKVFKGELKPDEAKKIVNKTFESITAEEFAFGEQHMINLGISDDVMVEGMDDIIDVFRDVLVQNELELPQGHPIQTYENEASAIEVVLLQMENLLKKKFIKNQWLEVYEKLNQINIHFSRKQNQLFSVLEQKGFDRPSKVMWTFDNNVRDEIKQAYILLNEDKDQEFIAAQENVIHLVRDILQKERDVLYPTSLKMISDEEFAQMRVSDDEIGYCLIENPPAFKLNDTDQPEESLAVDNGFMNELSDLLVKYGVGGLKDKNEVHDVSMGKLTLEQINLIFKHLQIDLSYVDENDIVKFYSDTKHRVFPRSAGVIGRKVQNCHPRESVETVEAIVEAFRKGEQDKAEFWLEMGDKFIYIIYNAVMDEEGNFRGVLEMMQDVTHIRSLKGSRKLLTWDNEQKESEEKAVDSAKDSNGYGIHADAVIAPLLKKYPFLKEYLITLNPKFKQLKNPVVFNTMGNIATLGMIAKRGGFEVNEFLDLLTEEVQRQSK